MLTHAQKIGENFSIPIPAEFAAANGITEGMELDLAAIAGQIVIRTPTKQRFSLSEMLNAIEDHQLTGEWNTGPAVGEEVW